MFEDNETVQESLHGSFRYAKKDLRVCLFYHKIELDKYNPLAQMSTIAFMLGVPAADEIKGMITVKNPAKPPESFLTWTISSKNEKETRSEFVKRFWGCWEEAKEKILELHGENISIIYEGRMLDSNGRASNN